MNADPAAPEPRPAPGPRSRRVRRWAPLLAAAAAGLLLGRSCAAADELPGCLREGGEILGYQLVGDAPVYSDGGLSIVAVRGPWVALRGGDGDGPTRWVDFRHVAGFALREP